MKITNVHVKRLTGLPRLLGTASVVFEDCFKVRDIFVLPKNKDELYIAMPSKKVRDNHWISMDIRLTTNSSRKSKTLF